MTLPGFIFQSGSQMLLNSRNACISSSPNMIGNSSAFDWPSPCSPEIEPPRLTTRCAASCRNSRNFAMPWRGFEIEVDARVHAALAEMAVQVAGIAVLVEQLAQLAQIAAQVFWRHRRIFPAFPSDRLVRHVRGCAQPSLAHLPDLLFHRRVVVQLHRRRVLLLLERIHQPPRLRVGLVLVGAAELHQQPAGAGRKQLEIPRMQVHRLHVGHQPVVHAFQRDRPGSHHFRHMVAGRDRHPGSRAPAANVPAGCRAGAPSPPAPRRRCLPSRPAPAPG